MAWRPPDNTAEIDRLTKLMAHYEGANLDHIQTIQTLNQTHEANAKRILELEKLKVQQNKTVKSLEGRMKFDKIAADGIKKKYDLLQVEVRDIKFANEQLNAERTEHVAKIEQLTTDLNQNRSDKLKFMHENAKLLKQNAELMKNESNAEMDAVVARTDLLSKLEALENVMKTNETFKRTVDTQSAEVLMSSHRIYDLQQQLLSTREHVVQLEAMSAEYNHTIDVLQHEISRLRKELMDASIGVSGQSAAVLTRSGASNRSNPIATNIIKTSYSFDGDNTAYALSRRPRTELGVSRGRNKTNSDSPHEHNSLGGRSSRLLSGSHSSLSLTEGSSHTVHSLGAGTVLPSLSEPPHMRSTTTAGSKHSTSHSVSGGQPSYTYKDLTSHLHTDHPTQKTPVIVDGGKISLGHGVQPTVRDHILQSYEGVVKSPKRVARAAEADALLHAPHTPSLLARTVDPVIAAQAERLLHTLQSVQASPASLIDTNSNGGLLSTTRSDREAFSACRPSGTPFRPMTHAPAPGNKRSPPRMHNDSHEATRASVALMQDAYSTSSSPGKSSLRKRDSSVEGAVSSGAGSQLHARSLSPLTFGTTSGAHTVDSNSVDGIGGLTLAEGSADHLHVTFGRSNSEHSTQPRPNNGTRGKKDDTAGKKSLFVGSGLGLKHNAQLDAELRNLNKGSTHQILKKILGDRFD
jgi:hypothetical protein